MTSRVFVDTGAWFAHFCARDVHHLDAVARMRALLASVQLVTSDYVFSELITLTRRREGFHLARRVGESLRAHPSLLMLEVASEIREAAWERFLRYQDHDVSFTDCTSFALIEEHRIPRIFTYDQDFRLTGREIVG